MFIAATELSLMTMLCVIPGGRFAGASIRNVSIRELTAGDDKGSGFIQYAVGQI